MFLHTGLAKEGIIIRLPGSRQPDAGGGIGAVTVYFCLRVSDAPQGMLRKGTVVRHLVLPGYIRDSMKIVEYLYGTYGDQIYISLMNQYTPLPRAADYPEISRRLTTYEYQKVVDYALELGVKNGYMQRGKTARESFIPDFDCRGIEKPERGLNGQG